MYEFHPDKNKEPGVKEKFKEIREAYEVLTDPEKRANQMWLKKVLNKKACF